MAGLVNRAIFLSQVLAGETVGLEEDEDGWRIWFGPVLLARLDREELERARRSGRRRPVIVVALSDQIQHSPAEFGVVRAVRWPALQPANLPVIPLLAEMTCRIPDS